MCLKIRISSKLVFWTEREGEKIGKYRSIKHPVHYSASPANIYADPPTLGADNDEIRNAVGLPKTEDAS